MTAAASRGWRSYEVFLQLLGTSRSLCCNYVLLRPEVLQRMVEVLQRMVEVLQRMVALFFLRPERQ